jgi:predicted DNA-binding transcriptional regulator AlpA
MNNNDIVRCSDIARMANVSPPTVSTWIKRYPSFPQPVDRYGSLKFYNRIDIEKWLSSNRPPASKPPRKAVRKPVQTVSVKVVDTPTKPTDGDWDTVNALGAAFERIALDRGERLSWTTLFIMAKTATSLIEGSK